MAEVHAIGGAKLPRGERSSHLGAELANLVAMLPALGAELRARPNLQACLRELREARNQLAHSTGYPERDHAAKIWPKDGAKPTRRQFDSATDSRMRVTYDEACRFASAAMFTAILAVRSWDRYASAFKGREDDLGEWLHEPLDAFNACAGPS